MTHPEADPLALDPVDLGMASLPTAFGDYLLLVQLGRGGMGEVYLAKQESLAGIQKVCVLKTLRSDMTSDQEYVTRFIDEARLVVQLNHRNICQVFDVGRVRNTYYLAMEHIAGRDLHSVLKRARDRGIDVPVELALYILAETLEALDYAHRLEDPASGASLQLVHRDVSPHNVMISFEGEVKLIDFGLAVSKLKSNQTGSGVVMGKLAFMSPEQARGDPITSAADQFAAAVIGYELLSGKSYYDGMSMRDVWQVVGTGRHRPSLWSALDDDLRAFLSRALSGEPGERYESCGDLRQEVLKASLRRSSTAGARELRAFMGELFGDEYRAVKRTISTFDNVAAIGVEHEAADQTVRIAAAAGLDDQRSSAVSPTAVTQGAHPAHQSIPPPSSRATATDATETIVRAPNIDVLAVQSESFPIPRARPGRRWLLLAGLLAAAALGGFVIWPGARPESSPVVQDRDVRAPATGDATREDNRAKVPSVGARVSTTNEAAQSPTARAPIAAEPVALARNERPREELSTEPAREALSTKATPDKRDKRRARRKKNKAKKRERAAPPKVPLKKMRSYVQKVNYLKKYCMGRVSCAKRLSARSQQLKGAGVDEIQTYMRNLDRCIRRCWR